MSLNEQCGLPVRTFGDAAVAQPVDRAVSSPTTRKPFVSHVFPRIRISVRVCTSVHPPGFIPMNFFGSGKAGKVVSHLCNYVLERVVLALVLSHTSHSMC